MLSVVLNKFTCPKCAVQTELQLSPPLCLRCPGCEIVFKIDKEKYAIEIAVRKFTFDPFLLKTGVTGKYKGQPFEIIGHIRSISSDSISNEFLMKFADGKELWLIECGFSYFVFDSQGAPVPPLTVKAKKVGSTLSFNSADYMIVDLSKQIAFQMDGQIPEDCYNDEQYFKYEATGKPIRNMLSINIFDKENIEAFNGVPVELADLQLSSITEFKSWI
jgi:hypothetical protein